MDTDSESGAAKHTVTNWFTVLSICLAVIFFGLAIAYDVAPWSDLFLGMATSFVFLAVTNILVRLQSWWSYRRIRNFFGSEIASSGILLAYPDFEHSPEASRALGDVKDIWQRPESIPSRGLPFPQHRFPIQFQRAVAANDIQALLLFASTVKQVSSVSAALIEDRSVWENPKRSFAAAGLTTNHCVMLYLITDNHPLLSIDEQSGHPIVHLAGGPTLVDDDMREFGLILRFAPDPKSNRQRRWWLLAGLEIAGTPAAAYYLHSHWKELEALTDSESDMLAVVSLPRGTWQDPRLEMVIRRPFGSTVPEVVFSTHYWT